MKHTLTALTVVTAVLGCAATANADAIDFGAFGPGNLPVTPACSTTVLNGVAVDCAATENWTSSGGNTVTTTQTGGAELTDKLTALGVPFADSGLGTSNIPAACENNGTNCESTQGEGVLATATGTSKITDAIVGSVDPPNEMFNFFVNGVLVASNVDHNCAAPNFQTTGTGLSCLWNSPDPAGVDSIEAITSGPLPSSTVLTEVSFAAPVGVSEPASWWLLGGALGALGILRLTTRRRRRPDTPAEVACAV